MFALLAVKNVIVFLRDVDSYFATKVRSTRSTRLCMCTCETEFLNNILLYSFLLNLSSPLTSLRGLITSG